MREPATRTRAGSIPPGPGTTSPRSGMPATAQGPVKPASRAAISSTVSRAEASFSRVAPAGVESFLTSFS